MRLQSILRSSLAWRLSGLTYTSAVLATRGRILSVDDYLRESETHTSILRPYLSTDCRVLEFGSGIGGNLIVNKGRFGFGVGIEINSGYLRIARTLSRRENAGNVEFLHYNGTEMPEHGRFDVVFSIGVFERLPKSDVSRYVHGLMQSLRPGGWLILYFLSTRAKGTKLTSCLGDEAYTFWELDEAAGLLHSAGSATQPVAVHSTPTSDVHIVRKL